MDGSNRIEQFLINVEKARTEHLTGTGQMLSRFSFPAELGVYGVGKAREGSQNIHTRLIGTSWLAHGGDASAVALSEQRMTFLAISQEMFQDFSLVHDDLLDHAMTRRGRASLQAHFEQMHKERGWLGGSGPMARSLALLIGDAILVVSDTVFSKALRGINTPQTDYILELQHLTRIEQMMGQAMDTVYPYLPDLDDPERIVESAFETIQAKTARYMAGTPLAMGAAGAGADLAEADIMMEFGLRLGEAYQLRDDQLGVTGDPALTGKPVGQDLVDGKRTVLVGLTLRRLSVDDRRAFAKALLRGTTPPVQARVAWLQRIIRESGALDELENMITVRRAEALEILETSEVDREGKAMLRSAADWLLSRTSS
ncbi:MAG: polyprenyl synthetase family protein [Bifidobacteriaceae bacterium]|jgi:geranylgeranyl diphosphate synthase type I|nr:polyprenyl synthetase family protein [Bifidobacteriaceae bacterium]